MEVKEHVWIRYFPWKELYEKKLESPFVPKVNKINYINKIIKKINKKNEIISIKIIYRTATISMQNTATNPIK